VIDVWEPVTESDVQTPMEVYQELVEDGYNVVSVGCCLCGYWERCRQTQLLVLWQ
jgi:hypothetical protein